MGLTESDRKLLIDEVNIVFHLAATIRFDEPLKKAVLLNTRGTKLVLELAKQMKNLEVFNKGFCTNNQPLGTNKQYSSEKKFFTIVFVAFPSHVNSLLSFGTKSFRREKLSSSL